MFEVNFTDEVRISVFYTRANLQLQLHDKRRLIQNKTWLYQPELFHPNCVIVKATEFSVSSISFTKDLDLKLQRS